MDDLLLDTSWTLHLVSVNSKAFRDIFASPLGHAQLQKYTDRLTQYLASHTPQYVDDLNDEVERLGAFKECKWSSFFTSSSQHRPAVSIEIIYQKQTYKFVLDSPYLILSKAPSTHTKRFFDFLTDTFGVLTDAVKLSPLLLSQMLAQYITSITKPFVSPNEDDEATRMSVLRSAIGNLKITIAFSGPIAPQLRTLDIDIPYETVDNLASRSLLAQTNSDPPGNTTDLEAGAKFLANLSHHITEHTGLKLPLSSSELSSDANNSTTSDTGPPLRVSRITSAAFAVSMEGKIKFSARAVENAMTYEGLIRSANGEMLSRVEWDIKNKVQALED